MREIVFATNNQHKLDEIRDIVSGSISILSLSDLGFFDDIPETGVTLQENALIKAEHIYKLFGVNCFADDTGLEIDALNGRPGVYSARYAGEGCTFTDNVNKVLAELSGVENRKARFRTVISLILEGRTYFFEGAVEGTIEKEFKGNGGFGYDPVFTPLGYAKTFAEMDAAGKNRISHRGLAVAKLTEFLQQI
ncbi:MAG: non-canonical purine NTP diphosphatase [Bacteroidales bacterium]|nr:non-canonical purine NTP diphosphatase [Bacteroidales bacterium]